ncbi:glycosyl transferase, partial [Mesorhizobium sp. M2C.T.Ca.TU.009.01.2.1]
AYSYNRLHLSDVRHLDSIGLDGVGGTMLMVDAILHRGGLRFPEIPYRDLIETEAFGVLANDLGIRPIGLPRLEILHVPW